jgi:hypothetical protein
VAATAAAATVDSVAKIADVGDAIFSGVLVIDVSAIDTRFLDEVYASPSRARTPRPSHGHRKPCGEDPRRHRSSPLAARRTSVVGRYLLPFVNCQRLTATTLDTYRYIRVYTTVTGTRDRHHLHRLIRGRRQDEGCLSHGEAACIRPGIGRLDGQRLPRPMRRMRAALATTWTAR